MTSYLCEESEVISKFLQNDEEDDDNLGPFSPPKQ